MKPIEIITNLHRAAEIKRTKNHLSNLQNQKETTMQKVFNPKIMSKQAYDDALATLETENENLRSEVSKLKGQVSALIKAKAAPAAKQPTPSPAKTSATPARELTGIERVSAAFAAKESNK